MAENPLTADSKQYQYDGQFITAATAFPAAGAAANSPSLDLLAATSRRLPEVVAVFKYDALPALVDSKYITIKLQECATLGGSYTDVGDVKTILGGTGNGHAAGQCVWHIPTTCARYIQVNVSVPADAGNNTGVNYTFRLGFWA